MQTLNRCAPQPTGAAEQSLDETTAVQLYRRHRREAEAEGLYQAFFIHRRVVASAVRRTLRDLELHGSAAATEFCDAQRHSVTTQLQLRSDTLPTLGTLAEHGITAAIVSNIDDDYIEPLLARWDLERRLAFWISSERARSCKPHANIFQQALAQVKCVPEQVLFVGDSHTNDVLGARRLGMQTALLTADLSPPWLPGADFYIAELGDIVDIISPSQN